MNTLGKRLKFARERLRPKVSQKALGERVNLSQQMIGKLENDKSEETAAIVRIATELGVRPEWLETGEAPMLPDPDTSNISPGPPLGRVPLISWVQAGEWCEVVDMYATGDADEWIITSFSPRRHTFALKVQGDSMSPRFPDGCYIVVEPDMDWQHGDCVVVKNGEGEATFKMLMKDGPDWYLKPINQQYQAKLLTPSCQIIGVVRESVMRWR